MGGYVGVGCACAFLLNVLHPHTLTLTHPPLTLVDFRFCSIVIRIWFRKTVSLENEISLSICYIKLHNFQWRICLKWCAFLYKSVFFHVSNQVIFLNNLYRTISISKDIYNLVKYKCYLCK